MNCISSGQEKYKPWGNSTCCTSVYLCSAPGIFFSPLRQLSTVQYFPPNKIMESHTNSFTWGESAVGKTSRNKKIRGRCLNEWRRNVQWINRIGDIVWLVLFFLGFLKLCIKINILCKSLCTEEVTQERGVQVTKYSGGYRSGSTVLLHTENPNTALLYFLKKFP